MKRRASMRAMCTLFLGRDALGAGTVVIGANRDEDPARPSDGPGVLSERPRVVGGRDRVAGGTWLAVREDRAVVALLNRSYGPPRTDRRSRGLLTLEVARAAPVGDRGDGDLPAAALDAAHRALSVAQYAPFALLFASRERCWVMTLDEGQAPRVAEIAPGWHVITHRDLDDRGEPRTARLLEELEGWKPTTVEQALERSKELLSLHGRPGAGSAREGAAVCLHEGRVVTVSSTIVALSGGSPRYLHAEGRPCERPFADLTHLLAQEA